MQDPDIRKPIADLMAEERVTRRFVVKRLGELINHPDGHVALKGIDIANKMRGEYPAEKTTQVGVNVGVKISVAAQKDLYRVFIEEYGGEWRDYLRRKYLIQKYGEEEVENLRSPRFLKQEDTRTYVREIILRRKLGIAKPADLDLHKDVEEVIAMEEKIIGKSFPQRPKEWFVLQRKGEPRQEEVLHGRRSKKDHRGFPWLVKAHCYCCISHRDAGR